MTFRSVSSSGGTGLRTRRSSPLSAAEYGVPNVCQWCPGCEDDAVDQNARDLHLARAQAAAFGHPLHLDDDQAAGVVHRGGHGERLDDQRLALHGDVAVRIGGGAAQQRHIERQRLVEQVLRATEGDQLHAVLGRPLVDLPATVPRVNERAQSHPGQQAGLAGGGVPEQLRDNALRQIMRLDLVAHRHLPQLWRHAPMTAHGPVQQALMGQPVQPPAEPVPRGHGKHQPQIAGSTRQQEPLLQRQREAPRRSTAP